MLHLREKFRVTTFEPLIEGQHIVPVRAFTIAARSERTRARRTVSGSFCKCWDQFPFFGTILGPKPPFPVVLSVGLAA